MKHILDWTPRKVLFVRALLTFVLAFMLAPLASAQTGLKWNESILTWTNPATTCDDKVSPLTECPVSGYRLEMASSCTATTWEFVANVPATPLSYKQTNIPAGPHCYRVKARYVVGTGTLETGAGPVNATSLKVTTAPAPSAPGAVVVSDIVAYEVRENSQGVMVASRIGVLPMGSLCGPEAREANGVTYNRVDAQSVDLINWPSSTARPVETFAKCGA